MEKILQVKYYGGFGENVVETYYKKEDKYLCERYSSGYWSGDTSTKEVTKADVEKQICLKMKDHTNGISEHIKALSELEKLLKKL